MITETSINAAANITTAVSALGLLIHIFGDPDNAIWNNKIKAWLAKVGLSIVICGAISNVMTLSTPPVTEVVLNVGVAITLFWLSWWQFELFKAAQSERNARLKSKESKSQSKDRGAARRTSVKRNKIK
jgi:protein-S-isoprenylcysteine O-methyltransferase Ste14